MSPLSYIHEDQYCTACNGSQDLRKERTACRYYQTGNCRRGSNCPFPHIPVPVHVESPAIPRPSYPNESMYTYYPLAQPPVYLPLSSPAQPVLLWRPYPPLSPSVDLRYGLVCQTENLPDYPDDTSDPSSAESSSTATSLDPPHVTLDTAWLEGIETGTLRGVAGPPGDLGTNVSSGHVGYSYPAIPGVQADGAVTVGGGRATSGPCLDQGTMVALPSPFLLPWQDDPRKKPLAYKTKPCKFYAANGKCTSGEKCTFIHDPGNAKKSSSKLAPPIDVKLPAKPIDKYDDCHARDYYPITWRVIGGGVMMGGQRQTCSAFVAGQCKHGNDCKLAHETELETDEVGFIEPKSEHGRRKGQASPHQGTKGTTQKRVRSSVPRKSGKVTRVESPRPVVFPATTPRPQRPHLPPLDTGMVRKKGEQVMVLSAPASPVHRRTQSMTIVTSPPPVYTTHSGYAAEL